MDFSPLFGDPKPARPAQIERAIAGKNAQPLLSADAAAELVSELKYQRAHIEQIVAANNAELERRRAAEIEAEQLRVDLTLARNECGRLRGVITDIADGLRLEGFATSAVQAML